MLGILFVFPVYSAENIEFNKITSDQVSFFGDDNDDDSNAALKNGSLVSRHVKALNSLKKLGLYSFIPNWICESDSCSDFLLKYSQQIVDISFLKCIRSVVILC
jgi:hypothetical protein